MASVLFLNSGYTESCALVCVDGVHVHPVLDYSPQNLDVPILGRQSASLGTCADGIGG